VQTLSNARVSYSLQRKEGERGKKSLSDIQPHLRQANQQSRKTNNKGQAQNNEIVVVREVEEAVRVAETEVVIVVVDLLL
jgi:hypothetical protein